MDEYKHNANEHQDHDKHPTYQKALYWGCGLILVGLIVAAVITLRKG